MPEGGICIIFNPGSGRDREENVGARIRTAFKARGTRVELREFDGERPLTEVVAKAAEEGFKTIVAAGGDGTICGVAEALSGRAVAMGVLPLGTFNYFARSLDIPDALEQAVDVILDGRARAVRTGTINGRVFLNNTSIGRYPEILQIREGVYRRWGRSRLAAYWSVLVTLMTLRRPLHLSIDADGTRHEIRTPLVFVLNNAFQLDQMGLEGADALAEGKLLMFYSPDAGRFGLIRQALALAMGVAVESRDFHLLSARRLHIVSRRKRQLVAMDGERTHLNSPLDIEAHSDALRVIVPESFTGEIR